MSKYYNIIKNHALLLVGGVTDTIMKNKILKFDVLKSFDGHCGKITLASSLEADIDNIKNKEGELYESVELLLASDCDRVELANIIMIAYKKIKGKQYLDLETPFSLPGLNFFVSNKCELNYGILVDPENLLPFYEPIIVGRKKVSWLWLIPLSENEADYINQKGWDSFWKMTKEKGFDLTGVCRGSYI